MSLSNELNFESHWRIPECVMSAAVVVVVERKLINEYIYHKSEVE